MVAFIRNDRTDRFLEADYWLLRASEKGRAWIIVSPKCHYLSGEGEKTTWTLEMESHKVSQGGLRLRAIVLSQVSEYFKYQYVS